MDEKFLVNISKTSLMYMTACLLIAVLGITVSDSALAQNPTCKKDSYDDQHLFYRHYRDCLDNQRTLRGSYILEALIKGKSVDISGAIIEGNIELIKLEKRGKKTDNKAVSNIKGEIKIMDSTIRGALRVFSSKRKDQVVFKRAVSLENVDFEPDPEGYRRSISVESAEFVEGINLNFSKFKRDVVFDKVLFKGPVTLFRGQFRSEKDEDKQYQSDARFVRCWFKNTANFANTIFKSTRFKGTSFNADVILRRSNFEEMSFESEPHRTGMVKGSMILTDAEGDKLKISNVTIGNELDLSSSLFSPDGSIYLKDTDINGRLRLDGAEIPRTVKINKCTIGIGLELKNINVKNNEIIGLDGSRISNISIELRTLLVPPELTWWMVPWMQPGTLRLSGLKDPVGFFRNFENNLRSKGNLAEANRAMYLRYYLESENEDRSIPSKVLFWMFDYSLGLGIRPVNIIFCGVIFIIGFGIFFSRYIQDRTIDLQWGLWLTKLPISYACQGGSAASITKRFWWALCLSTALFIKANFGGSYKIQNGLTIRFAKIEWVIGAIWIIVFLYSLSGRHDFIEIIVDAVL